MRSAQYIKEWPLYSGYFLIVVVQRFDSCFHPYYCSRQSIILRLSPQCSANRHGVSVRLRPRGLETILVDPDALTPMTHPASWNGRQLPVQPHCPSGCFPASRFDTQPKLSSLTRFIDESRRRVKASYSSVVILNPWTKEHATVIRLRQFQRSCTYIQHSFRLRGTELPTSTKIKDALEMYVRLAP